MARFFIVVGFCVAVFVRRRGPKYFVDVAPELQIVCPGSPGMPTGCPGRCSPGLPDHRMAIASFFSPLRNCRLRSPTGFLSSKFCMFHVGQAFDTVAAYSRC